MYQYYLFDFDGTLVDSMPTFCTCMLRILDENHITYPADITKTITPLGLNGTATYFIDVMGVKMDKIDLMKLMGAYLMDAYLHTIPAKEFVIEALKELKSRGASLNVLTASPHMTLDPCMKRLGMWELFDNVWSCDDFHTTKADPGIYTQVAEKLGAAVEQILFLDDNLNADLTAKKAGMPVCGVYDDSSKEYVEQMKQANDYYIYNFKELLAIKKA